ncbi:hypothetical protein VNO78_12755 [Psophocarpus tetragonolobus]|uniref:Uncharacterized protein n=1 Tax=Psophocarpus tetragonolobus TaxID=3891 RepID=A0AAN9SRG8_PSOTE
MTNPPPQLHNSSKIGYSFKLKGYGESHHGSFTLQMINPRCPPWPTLHCPLQVLRTSSLRLPAQWKIFCFHAELRGPHQSWHSSHASKDQHHPTSQNSVAAV